MFAKAEGNPWLPWIGGVLCDGFSDGVLVTPLGAPKKKRDEFLQGLRQLYISKSFANSSLTRLRREFSSRRPRRALERSGIGAEVSELRYHW
jgi:hypothetical protein